MSRYDDIHSELVVLNNQLLSLIQQRDKLVSDREAAAQSLGVSTVLTPSVEAAAPSTDTNWFSSLFPSTPQVPGEESTGAEVSSLQAGFSPWMIIPLAGIALSMVFGKKKRKSHGI